MSHDDLKTELAFILKAFPDAENSLLDLLADARTDSVIDTTIPKEMQHNMEDLKYRYTQVQSEMTALLNLQEYAPVALKHLRYAFQRIIKVELDLMYLLGLMLPGQPDDKSPEPENAPKPKSGMAMYDREANVLRFSVAQSQMDSDFVKYMLEYLHIPLDAELRFADEPEKEQ